MNNMSSQQPMLPPIQQLEGQPQNHQQSQNHQQPMHQQQYAQPTMNGTQMQHHPPPPPHNSYSYHDASLQQSPMTPNGPANGHLQMRYALPPQPVDARQMSGGRHKKEIKRRTKTGCLTCRKRRIKVGKPLFFKTTRSP